MTPMEERQRKTDDQRRIHDQRVEGARFRVEPPFDSTPAPDPFAHITDDQLAEEAKDFQPAQEDVDALAGFLEGSKDEAVRRLRITEALVRRNTAP